jgi:hypothetical protein
MIKTVYFDEDYNTVDESNAKFILQSIFDDDGNLIKEIEWSPKQKQSFSNKDAKNRFVSKSIREHHLETIVGIQRVIDLLWRYHGISDDITQKQQILNTLLRGYERLNFAIGNLEYNLKNKKEDFDFDI